MSGNECYNWKGTENFVIEDGIIKGYDEPHEVQNCSNFGEIVLEGLKAQPNFVAQVDALTGNEVTFAEMLEKSVKCAMWLRAQNIQPGDVIGLCTHNHVNTYVPCFAAMYVGAVHNAWWNKSLTKEMAKYFMNLAKPKIVFASEDTVGVILETAEEIGVEMKIVVFGKCSGLQSLDDILSTQDVKQVPEFHCTALKSLEEPAFILYTSGTGGLPKGVVFSHKSFRSNVIDIATLKSNDLKSNFMSLNFSAICWFGGHNFLYRSVVRPETRIVHPEFSEETCFRLIEKYKVKWLYLPSSVTRTLTKSPEKANYDLSSMRYMLLGGAPVSVDLQEATAELFPNAVIRQGYGSSELGGIGVRQDEHHKIGSIGRVIKNYTLKVVDPETGRVLGPNRTGEACFKYPFMMSHYNGNPEETSKVIDAEGWLHTGDLLFYDEEGYLFYVDRMKDVIQYRDNHVSPGMIERVLLTHPGVARAAAVGLPHATDDMHPIAFVVKTANAEVTEEELQKLVADALPDYMRLRGGVKFLKELPHTMSGKVARGELKKLAKSFADETSSK